MGKFYYLCMYWNLRSSWHELTQQVACERERQRSRGDRQEGASMSEEGDSTDANQADTRERGLPFTRRSALAIGSALMGLGLTGGTAGAASSDRGRPVPGASPWNDEDGDGLLESDEQFDGIDAGILNARPTEIEENLGIVPRELISQEDTTIHVDPSGDDDNDGSEGNPVATIQEAANRLPLFVLHDLTLDIADGEYTDEKESPAVHVGPLFLKGEGDINFFGEQLAASTTAASTAEGKSDGHTFGDPEKSRVVGDSAVGIASDDGSQGTVTIAGNDADPSSVYVDVGINWTAFGKLEHMRVHGIHWDSLSQFAGQADVRNSTFRGNGAAAISGKNGHVFFKNCDIGGRDRDTFAVWGIQLERMYFDYCTISATEAALNVFNGDIYQLSGRNAIDAPETFTMSGGAIATQGTDLYVGGERK